MPLRRPKQERGDGERWLEVDASMTGSLTFKDPVNLQINGQFDGTLDTKGSLAIGEHATVKATIQGEAITVAGTVQGAIVATGRLELAATARILGKVTTPRLVMHDGAVLHGSVEMVQDRPDEAWMSIDDLARYLEVESGTVTQWANEGRLPGQQDNGQWRFERTKIEEWVAQERMK